jgi:hypothetical protein
MEGHVRYQDGTGNEGVAASQNKRQYQRPTLICYGSVMTLTTSGSGHASEGGRFPDCRGKVDKDFPCR